MPGQYFLVKETDGPDSIGDLTPVRFVFEAFTRSVVSSSI